MMMYFIIYSIYPIVKLRRVRNYVPFTLQHAKRSLYVFANSLLYYPGSDASQKSGSCVEDMKNGERG